MYFFSKNNRISIFLLKLHFIILLFYMIYAYTYVVIEIWETNRFTTKPAELSVENWSCGCLPE